jgi:hypothetical protein
MRDFDEMETRRWRIYTVKINTLIRTITIAMTLVLPSLYAQHTSETVPAGSTVYVDTNNGFDLFIQAAFQSKRVPLKLVSSADKADYILDSSLFHENEFMATQKVAGTYRISEAAFKLTSKGGDVVWAYAATKGMFSKGAKQSVAEACAKHIKAIVERAKKKETAK